MIKKKMSVLWIVALTVSLLVNFKLFAFILLISAVVFLVEVRKMIKKQKIESVEASVEHELDQLDSAGDEEIIEIVEEDIEEELKSLDQEVEQDYEVIHNEKMARYFQDKKEAIDQEFN